MLCLLSLLLLLFPRSLADFGFCPSHQLVFPEVEPFSYHITAFLIMLLNFVAMCNIYSYICPVFAEVVRIEVFNWSKWSNIGCASRACFAISPGNLIAT